MNTRGVPETLATRFAASDFAAVADVTPPRESVAAAIAGAVDPVRPGSRGSDSSRVLGTVVHRLVQRAGLGPGAEVDELRADVLRWLRGEEILGEDEGSTVDAALAAYLSLREHPDVRELYATGDVLHEVPFTMRHEGRIVRGTIDCVVMSGDVVTVLEFKTGRPRPEHESQAAMYREAAARLFPGTTIASRIIYLR